jgi:hypothetical protein
MGSFMELLVDSYLFSPLVEFILLNLLYPKKINKYMGPKIFVALTARHTQTEFITALHLECISVSLLSL